MSKVIALCGAASCGKTTTAYALRNHLNKDNVVEIIPEYAREYLLKIGYAKCILAQTNIFNEQLEREIKIIGQSEANIVICECPLFLNYLYTLSMNLIEVRKVSASEFLSKIYKRCIEQLYKYDYVFYLPVVNTKFTLDTIRHEAAGYRKGVDAAVKGFLDMHALHYETIDCSKEERANMILELLGDKI